MNQRTLILIKPDGLKRRLSGNIIQKLENKGLNIVALKLVKVTEEMAKRHYSVHESKPFFKDLVEYITSDPVVAMIMEGKNAITVVRNLVGATDGSKAAPGTIRGDYSISIDKNIIHASDSEESYKHEGSIFFSANEIHSFSYGDENLF